ncbi:Type II secretory pathway component [Pseudomonas stutzeri]|nr:Type II secretory pathway component [Stutzerimonas stutzeri]
MSRVLCLLAGLLALPAMAALDPTQPPRQPVAGAAASDALLPVPPLQAILRGPAGARAVIGGHSLRVGERHGELQLLAIRARSVLVEHQGQRHELHLSQPILTPANRSPSR